MLKCTVAVAIVTLSDLPGKLRWGATPNKLAEAKGQADVLLAIRRAFEVSGDEYTNCDQPGLRLTRTAAVRTDEPADP